MFLEVACVFSRDPFSFTYKQVEAAWASSNPSSNLLFQKLLDRSLVKVVDDLFWVDWPTGSDSATMDLILELEKYRKLAKVDRPQFSQYLLEQKFQVHEHFRSIGDKIAKALRRIYYNQVSEGQNISHEIVPHDLQKVISYHAVIKSDSHGRGKPVHLECSWSHPCSLCNMQKVLSKMTAVRYLDIRTGDALRCLRKGGLGIPTDQESRKRVYAATSGLHGSDSNASRNST
ncbi:hypothetical protein R1flu_003631 [Riccia fluitans]|uniref:Uncharacterized protein n=1 Tax=Riccia fluitans TaxID=41844 RepID=A0ABD1Y9L6_9MARC